MKNKKGDLPSGFIIGIIILIIGFGILLFFLLRFIWQENIDKQVCHESVVFRGTASALSTAAESYVPLKCKTAKYCVTTGLIGGKCNSRDKEGNPEPFFGEEHITKVKVKSKTEIEKFIAEEIVSCWSMMGEGKLSLFTSFMAAEFGLGTISSSCVICDRIAFDEEALENAGIKWKELEVEKYMMEYKMPEKEISYMRYLVGENGKIKVDTDAEKAVEAAGEKFIETSAKEELEPYNSREILEKKASEKNEISIMFMQIISPKGSAVLKNTFYAAAGVGVGGLVIAPVKTVALIAAKAVSVAFWKVAAPVAALFLVSQQINTILNRDIAAMKCGDVSVGKEARDGCSVVRTVNYNVNELAQYCSAIESIA